MSRVTPDANWVADDTGIVVGQRLANGSVAAPFVNRSYTAAQLSALAAAGGLTPYASYVASDTGARSYAQTASTLVSDEGSGEVSLRQYVTQAQWAAMVANDYTGIDLDAFATAIEQAFNTTSAKVTLTIPAPCKIKLNRPIRYDGELHVRGLGSIGTGGVVFYPDLSINWPVAFPNRGLIESSNYQFPQYPIYNNGGVGSGAAGWANSKPDYVYESRLEGFSVRCHYDSAAYTAHPEYVPDYGIVTHCPNEAWSAHRVYVFRARKACWLFTGLLSTPGLYECGAMQAGYGIDTIFGDAVTRTTGGAFGANVFVYTTPTPGAASATLLLEAAGATDLDAIIAGNVLTIGGVGYTVASVGAASQAINQITFISAARTDTRYVRLVTLNASPALPAATGNIMRGRVLHAGLAVSYVPGDASRFAAIISSDGGNSVGGAMRLYDYSGDSNRDTMILCEGAGTITALGLKAEYNPSAVVYTGSANGGAKPKLVLGGYRISSSGTFVSNSQPGLDQSVIRVAGGVCRPSVVSLGGQADAAYVKFIQDLSNSGDLGVTNVSGGQGFVHWCADYGEPAHIANIGGREVNLVSDGASFTAVGASSASYRMRWKLFQGTGYRFQIGIPGSEQTLIEVLGAGTPNSIKYRAYNGSTMVDMLTFNNSGGMGFFAATPVAKPTVTGAKGSNAALGSLMTALAALGLVTDSTTA